MGDFLDSLSFLSPEQRASLRADDLDTAVAFAHVTVSMLQAPPFGLTIGKASRLLAAAHGEAVASPAPAPSTLVVNIAEPPDLRTRIERALLLAEQDPSTIGALADLGVDLVVQDEHGKVWPAATIAMRAHASTGAPIGKTWQGAKIVSVHALAAPTVWCSPRTSRPLQDGKDEVTGAEMTDWQKKYLPEICMAVHMHHTGACDDLTNEQHASAVAYLETRVSRWNAHSNGRRWIGFDTQVLALCLSTLAEAREWMSERATMDAKCTTATIASEP